MLLRHRTSIVLVPSAPFHFDGTVFNPSHFPSSDQHWEPGHHWQTLLWKERIYGIRLQNAGTTNHPRVKATVFSRGHPPAVTIQEIAEELKWRFDMTSTGVPEFVARFKNDVHIGSAIRRHPGMRATSGCSLYEFLVITVVLQNATVRRSVRMLQSLFEQYGRQVSFDEHVLWAFWRPELVDRAPEAELRRLKLGYRAKTLKMQAEAFARGKVDEESLRSIHDEHALAETLDQIYGVGSQSAWYMLFEFFHFYDAQERISPWEGNIVGRLLFGRDVPEQRVRELLTRHYGRFRQLAFHYLMTDIFWQHRERAIPWLTKLVRL